MGWIAIDLLEIMRVVLFQRLQHTNLNLTRVAILLHRANNLDGNFFPRLDVACFDDFTKRALSEQTDDFVCASGFFIEQNPR